MPQPQRTPFGEWLHGWRQKRRLTQEQLAQAALITKRDVERYETKHAPRADTFLRLISALGLSIDGLPQGPKAVNAELMETRKELAAMRRMLDRRLEALETGLAGKADAQDVRQALETLRARERRRTDEATRTPREPARS